ncbi:MAG: DNA/RNA non-specific endonuclease [Pirellulaceae bacterium]
MLWRQIEDYLTKRGDESRRRISIFNGPILRDHDRIYKKVKLPREFWKVVVFRDDSGSPKSLALRLTQASLIQGLEEAFLPSEYETVQVSIKSIEADTGLNFGKIAAWDTLEQEKSLEHLAMGTSVVRIRDLSQIVL